MSLKSARLPSLADKLDALLDEPALSEREVMEGKVKSSKKPAAKKLKKDK